MAQMYIISRLPLLVKSSNSLCLFVRLWLLNYWRPDCSSLLIFGLGIKKLDIRFMIRRLVHTLTMHLLIDSLSLSCLPRGYYVKIIP